MPTILITGANRGIGFELVKRFDALHWRVLACCRRPGDAASLHGLASASNERIAIHAVDVADHASIDALGRALANEPIDVLLNNAGIMNSGQRTYRPGLASQQLGSIDVEEWLRVLRVNVMGPARVTEVLMDNVARSERKIVGILSSIVGSIENNVGGGLYHYRSSKTAVNMLVRNMATELAPHGITAVALHPGWARTDMGGAGAPVAVEESGSGLTKVITSLNREQTGRFITWQGNELPW